MVRRRIEDQSEDAEIIDAEADDVTALHEEQKEEEQDILSHFGAVEDGVKMHFQVHKVRPNSKITDWCFEGTRDDFPIVPRIQQEFGSGTYKIMIFKNGRLFKSPSLGVLAPKTPVIPTPVGPDPNFAKLIEVLEKRTANNDRPPPSALETMTGIAAIVTAAAPILQMLIRSNSNSGSVKDTMEMLATAKELFSGDSDREKGPLELAGEILGPMLAGMQNAKGPQQPAAPALPKPSAPTPEQIQQAQMAQLKQQLGLLIGRARNNSDPALYAELLADTLPPQYVQMLVAPGALDFLATLEPGILTYRPWFEELLHALTEGVNDDAPDAGDASGDHVPTGSPASVASAFDAGRPFGGAYNAQGNEPQSEGGENQPAYSAEGG